ncbi:MAG: M48 family metallopeptidase [Oscillospiraceae bacterium]|nr:M48 family metallopeptidase [Oscillospiraceae bacterium]MBQ7130022.1 M48 family metallopeptidase [Oscillospiraceae bacterium]
MKELSYQIIRSSRKTVSIQILPSGEILVRCPNRMPNREIQAFVDSKRRWIEGHLAVLQARPALQKLTTEQLHALADQALEIIPPRTAHFAAQMGLTYGRITIRNQHTRWGSCSAKGNLNFNCLLMLCPPEVLDYVIVHELCHRRQLNHSPAFWAEVEQIMPDYRLHRAWLKENGGSLIARLP